MIKEDIVNLAEEAGYTEDIVGDEFLTARKGGIGNLVAMEVKLPTTLRSEF